MIELFLSRPDDSESNIEKKIELLSRLNWVKQGIEVLAERADETLGDRETVGYRDLNLALIIESLISVSTLMLEMPRAVQYKYIGLLNNLASVERELQDELKRSPHLDCYSLFC